ncbi:MAG: hypothetical protein D6684_00095, partial [Deinococcus-Thermus bacterium]
MQVGNHKVAHSTPIIPAWATGFAPLFFSGMLLAVAGPSPDSGWILDWLAERTPTLVDEFGSFYAWLEGGHGGATLLLWMPSAWLEEALPQLPRRFKGRIVLGLDGSEGHGVPFGRALDWAAPRYALVLQAGQGLGNCFPGRKEVAEGLWVPWDDPRPPRRLEVPLGAGLAYWE